jgi:hypothetical protein
MEGGDDGGIDRVVDSKDLQQQSKALDKLTDRVEDRQLDSTRVQEVLSLSLSLLSSVWLPRKCRKKKKRILQTCDGRCEVLVLFHMVLLDDVAGDGVDCCIRGSGLERCENEVRVAFSVFCFWLRAKGIDSKRRVL